MTKLRPSLTVVKALDKIGRRIGWAEMAMIATRAAGAPIAERTLRDWGEPNTSRSVPIAIAIALDAAYQARGGHTAPILEIYRLQLKLARRAQRAADRIELAHRICTVIREGADAEEALVLASLPGATDAHRATAVREIEGSIEALTGILPLLIGGEPP